jgi:hypothetical protein
MATDLKRPAPKGVQWLAIGVLTAATIVATGLPLLRAAEDDATRNAIELIQIAHSQARTLAIRHGHGAVLRIDPEAGRLWVEVDTSVDGSEGHKIVRVVEPPRVTILSDQAMLCFDARGRPDTGGDCQPAPGSITVRTMTGEQTLVVDAQGRLLRL